MDLTNIKNIHIIGIEGAGTSALALVLQGMGKKVTGSDEGDHFYYDVLAKAGVTVFHKFNVKNITPGLDLIIYSTSQEAKTNPELKKALASKVPVLGYPEALGLVFNRKFGIAVAGTHGKTTTTAMLALAMKEAGADPTAIIGSKIKQLGKGAIIGTSEYFIIEADEYQNKFKYYNPMGVVLTNVDFDHPDYFKNEEVYKDCFKTFIRRIPAHGFLIACADDGGAIEVAKEARCQVIFYGKFLETTVEHEIKNEFEKNGNKNIKLLKIPSDLKLKIPGQHNISNATAVLAVGDKLGLARTSITEALKKFQGTARRLELVGERKGTIIIDDYAHHPEEIKVTLKAIDAQYPEKKIMVVFQPHTFTRTEAFLGEFAQSFSKADEIVVLDIFGSAREKKGEIHARDLVKKIERYMKKVEYGGTIEETYEFLKNKLDKNTILVTMGAGDVWKLAQKLVAKN